VIGGERRASACSSPPPAASARRSRRFAAVRRRGDARLGPAALAPPRPGLADGSSSVDTAYPAHDPRPRLAARWTAWCSSGRVPGPGAQLAELREALLALLDECRVEDPPSARVLEAYLDRVEPSWRQGEAGAEQPAGAGGRQQGGASGSPPPGRNA
jgi:hypothetical protein